MKEEELVAMLQFIDGVFQELLRTEFSNDVDPVALEKLNLLALACMYQSTVGGRQLGIDRSLNFVICVMNAAYHIGRKDGLGIRGSNLLKGVK